MQVTLLTARADAYLSRQALSSVTFSRFDEVTVVAHARGKYESWSKRKITAKKPTRLQSFAMLIDALQVRSPGGIIITSCGPNRVRRVRWTSIVTASGPSATTTKNTARMALTRRSKNRDVIEIRCAASNPPLRRRIVRGAQ